MYIGGFTKMMFMQDKKVLNYINKVVDNTPTDWLKLTTHRLDIYDEELAKTQFLEQFESLFNEDNAELSALSKLPTAYDYIRLGHPLSSVLEWGIAKINQLNAEEVISFTSKTIPVLAVLRKNLFDHKKTSIYYSGNLPKNFDKEIIENVYGYQFELKEIASPSAIEKSDSSIIFIEEDNAFNFQNTLYKNVDFTVKTHPQLGSVLLVNGKENEDYISAIQHVRRRETVAMTPANSYAALKLLAGESAENLDDDNVIANRNSVIESVKKITKANTEAVVASSGLSMQYAIMMGLIHDAQENHKGKAIKFLVPPNCYGGTNDQARRVAACLDNVEIVDLPVDGDNEMVESIDTVLEKVAKEDAVPYIIAEIPTNPRVEVPDLDQLRAALSKKRQTANGEIAIHPVFILDQTFCPNVHFLGDEGILSSVRTISYLSGSKFPSGGLCTAGYCVANDKAADLMDKIDLHLKLTDNAATNLQMEILAKQLPSMNERIGKAYKNTREFVNYIHETLPEAKINFVSEELAEQGFTSFVFSLDLPTKGNTEEEREEYKRALNLKLINLMITEIPNESKFCVSYGQLKGCYWTIPATSTQGTTKEGDKDYIVRVSVSGNLDLEKHKEVFKQFVDSI